MMERRQTREWTRLPGGENAHWHAGGGGGRVYYTQLNKGCVWLILVETVSGGGGVSLQAINIEREKAMAGIFPVNS